MDIKSLVTRAPDMMAAPVDQDLVILNLIKNSYIGLDGVGRRIWELLEQPKNIEDLCRALSAEFDGSPEEITGDVLSFVKELEAEGLLHVG